MLCLLLEPPGVDSPDVLNGTVGVRLVSTLKEEGEYCEELNAELLMSDLYLLEEL